MQSAPERPEGAVKLQRQANVGLLVTLAIIALVVVFLKTDGKHWFESRQDRIDRLTQDELTTSLELRYCGQTGANCAALQAKLDVTREKLREVYR